MTIDPNGANRPRPVLRLWGRALAVGLGAAVFGGLYFFIRQFLKDGVWRFDLTLVNKALGTAALLLLTLSMLLTGVVYFSGNSRGRLAYRKYYGLIGFWLALAHGVLNHMILPAVGLSAESSAGTRHGEALGLAALIVFALMTSVSNTKARGRMGGEPWRRFLRYAGYGGLVLSAGHAALLKGPSWAKFFGTFKPFLPSLSLPVAGLAAAAVALRVWIFIAEKRKGAKPTSASPGL